MSDIHHLYPHSRVCKLPSRHILYTEPSVYRVCNMLSIVRHRFFTQSLPFIVFAIVQTRHILYIEPSVYRVCKLPSRHILYIVIIISSCSQIAEPPHSLHRAFIVYRVCKLPSRHILYIFQCLPFIVFAILPSRHIFTTSLLFPSCLHSHLSAFHTRTSPF